MHAMVANEVHQAPHIPPVCVNLLTFNNETVYDYDITYLVVRGKNEFVREVERDQISVLIPLDDLFDHFLRELSFPFCFESDAYARGRKPLGH